MNLIKRFAFVLLLALTQSIYAVEISPEIGVHQPQSPKSGLPYPKGESLNNKIFSQNQVTKLVPDVDSIGLNFKFEVD